MLYGEGKLQRRSAIIFVVTPVLTQAFAQSIKCLVLLTLCGAHLGFLLLGNLQNPVHAPKVRDRKPRNTLRLSGLAYAWLAPYPCHDGAKDHRLDYTINPYLQCSRPPWPDLLPRQKQLRLKVPVWLDPLPSCACPVCVVGDDRTRSGLWGKSGTWAGSHGEQLPEPEEWFPVSRGFRGDED